MNYSHPHLEKQQCLESEGVGSSHVQKAGIDDSFSVMSNQPTEAPKDRYDTENRDKPKQTDGHVFQVRHRTQYSNTDVEDARISFSILLNSFSCLKLPLLVQSTMSAVTLETVPTIALNATHLLLEGQT